MLAQWVLVPSGVGDFVQFLCGVDPKLNLVPGVPQNKLLKPPQAPPASHKGWWWLAPMWGVVGGHCGAFVWVVSANKLAKNGKMHHF